MTNTRDFILEIIQEITRHENSVEPILDPNDPLAPLRILPVGNKRAISSQKIEELISSVGVDLQKNERWIAESFGIDELYHVLRKAFSQAIAEIDLEDDPLENADTVLTRILGFIKQDHDAIQSREYYFPCILFWDTDTAPFRIGPVQFEPRANWLARKVADRSITRKTQQRIERAWQGAKLRKRKSSIDSVTEQYILNCIWNFPFICNVETKGYAPNMGREKALFAARIAMTSIALLWQDPKPSKTLDGFKLSFDLDRTMGKRVTSIYGELGKLGFAMANRYMPDGLMLPRGAWEKVFKKCNAHFTVTGEVLDYYLNPQQTHRRPKLMNTLFHALLWFHEGCLEQSSLLSVLKFAASMDALAIGKGEGRILNLIEARLGKEKYDQVFADGSTTRQTICDIYRYARSKTIHGNNEKLGYDWSETQARAEQITRLCLNACLNWAATNPNNDNPKHLSK